MGNRSHLRLAETATAAPLYKEVQRRILQCLAEGLWKPGARLPPEGALAERFGVAVSTVRAGVRGLDAAGVLVRRQGTGTFVARHDQYTRQFRYSNIYDGRGSKVSTTRDIISMRKERADRETVRLLALQSEAVPLVHRIMAILRVGAAAVATMNLVLPVALFPRLRQKDLESADEHLYSVYQRVCGVSILRMEERVHARIADARTARILKLPAGHPLLAVERIGYTFNNRPAEIRRRTYEGTRHHYLFTHDQLD